MKQQAVNQRQAIQIDNEETDKKKQHLTGKLELHTINDNIFNEQFYNYNRFGVVIDTASGGNKYL